MDQKTQELLGFTWEFISDPFKCPVCDTIVCMKLQQGGQMPLALYPDSTQVSTSTTLPQPSLHVEGKDNVFTKKC